MFGRVKEAVRQVLGREPRDMRVGVSGQIQSEAEIIVGVEEDTLDGGYIAVAMNVPGAASQGETIEEALDNLSDALSLVLSAQLSRYFADHSFEITAIERPQGGRQLSVPLDLKSSAAVEGERVLA